MIRNLVTILVLLLSASAFAEPIELGGSDLLADTLDPVLETFEGETGQAIEHQFEGSFTATENVRNGQLDLAILAIPADAEPPEGLELIPFAFQVVYVVVEPETRITDLGFSDLKAIFATETTDPIERWSDLETYEGDPRRPILPAVVSEPNTITAELFGYQVLNNAPLARRVEQLDSLAEFERMLGGESGILAIVGRPAPDNEWKSVPVKDERQGNFGYLPSPESVFFGDYPLRLPFYLAFQENQRERLRPLLERLLSQETAEALRSAGFMPLPDSARNRAISSIDKR